jgi:hypothetical protein
MTLIKYALKKPENTEEKPEPRKTTRKVDDLPVYSSDIYQSAGRANKIPARRHGRRVQPR